MKKLDTLNIFFISVIFFYFVGNLFLILSNYLDGGHGDSTHRILFARDFLDYGLREIFKFHLVSPWPPFPFLIQASFFKFLKIFNFGLVYSIYILSLLLAIIHLIIIFWFFKKNKKRFLGIIYVIFFTTSGTLNEIFISSMSEIYALFLLSFSLIIFNRKINFLLTILLSLIFFLATLCRSEIIFLSLSLFLFLFFFSKKSYSLVFLLISFFPFVIKNIFFLLYDFHLDSNSITMGNVYNFGSLYERFYNSLSGIVQFLKWQNFTGISFVICLFTILSIKNSKIIFLKKNSLIFFLGITYLIFVLLMFAFGPITQNLRYLFIPTLITFIGLILILEKDINEEFSIIFKNKIFIIYFFTFFGLLLNLYFLTKSVPSEIRYAKNFLIEKIANNKSSNTGNSLLFIDNLLGHEMYFMMHTIVHFNNNLAANQYDIRPSPSMHLKTNSNINNENVSLTELKILSYINEFKPSYLILATGEYRYKLETLTFNYDKNERSSYILPNSQYLAKNDLELNFIKIGRQEKFLYKKIYKGNLLSIYEFKPSILLN